MPEADLLEAIVQINPPAASSWMNGSFCCVCQYSQLGWSAGGAQTRQFNCSVIAAGV